MMTRMQLLVGGLLIACVHPVVFAAEHGPTWAIRGNIVSPGGARFGWVVFDREGIQSLYVAEDRIPADANQIKFDGYRLLASKSDGEPQLLSRSGGRLDANFPEVVETLAHLPYRSVIFDGEVVVVDAQGLPSFARLQRRAF